MFKFFSREINKQNYINTIILEKTKIICGSFFDENSIIDSIKIVKEETNSNKMEIDDELINYKQKIAFPLSQSETELIETIISDINIIIITNLQEILCWPYILKRFKLDLTSIKIISTRPITQIAKHYLLEFYNSFNILSIRKEDNFDMEASNCYVDEMDINNFISIIEKPNYGEKVDIEPYLKVILTSSGYELGSSNILFEFYNKKLSIMSKSSLFEFRYPKEFDWESLKNSDILICLPEIIHYNSNDYESQIAKLAGEIYKIVSKLDLNSASYPTILMPVEVLFMLDFVDFLIYKTPKEVKNIFISQSIKPIIEYANISHGFINKRIHDKIYEFKLPFNFDELIKNNQFYMFKNFEELLKSNLITSYNVSNISPIIYMVNKFSYVFGEAYSVFENFSINSSHVDSLVYLSNILQSVLPYSPDNSNKNFVRNYQTLNFNLDYRITFQQYLLILEKINPSSLIYHNKEKDNIDFIKDVINNNLIKNTLEYSSVTNEKNDTISIQFSNDEVMYNKIFFVGKTINEYDKFCYDSGLNPDKLYTLDIEKENDNLYVSLNKDKDDKINNTSVNYLEQFERDLNKLLKGNDMIINELLSKENEIHISIVKKNTLDNLKNSFSDIIIKLSEIESPIISISVENSCDGVFLNKIIQLMFN